MEIKGSGEQLLNSFVDTRSKIRIYIHTGHHTQGVYVTTAVIGCMPVQTV